MSLDVSTYQEQKIKSIIAEMQTIYLDIQIREEVTSKREIDYEFDIRTEQLEDEFCTLAQSVYIISSAYIESKKMQNYYSDFANDLKFYLINKSNLLSSSYHEESGEIYSEFINKLWRYLLAFPAFDGNNEKILKRSGLHYLENILESTAFIVKELGIKPKKETEVYNGIKFIVQATFPNTHSPDISFIKTAKHYVPDVLIPSLNVAIEYKFARSLKRLTNTMDEILIDVKGYDNNPTYKIFYAVFYVKAGILSPKRFHEIWKEKEFPENWKPIFVEAEM
ncbi:PD-(D/E)XK nuclease domain-containing protein [Sphingobacterium faecale]|uniref:Restriction endonuclease n=1 Tax=Sphingobacterium faecale TaxID=2803775 RepID=A0ABS1R8Q7_9SPHI|nr:hypothetical protein [Sphingobacterium faecale]MBL1411102.1 hypothetical protein [Sphingobacterium faecale]